jgi:hypothetical protein
MRTFVYTMFWMNLATAILRLISLVYGTYSRPSKIGVYAADTVLIAAVVVWAGFVLWYDG